MKTIKRLLTIAGSDSSGGAGIQADLKTFTAHGAYGMSAVTSVTAQNTVGVTAIHDIPSEVVGAQIDAVFSDIGVDGVKIGMLSNVGIAEVVAERLRHYEPKFIVFDPVMVSTSGSRLLSEEAIDVIKTMLMPLATMVTPNIPEAETLTGIKISNISQMCEAAELISDNGPEFVLVKGGHLTDTASDILYNGEAVTIFEGTRINSDSTHGTGCTISSAICANLANGMCAADAVSKAKAYVRRGIENAPKLGKGNGPLGTA